LEVPRVTLLAPVDDVLVMLPMVLWLVMVPLTVLDVAAGFCEVLASVGVLGTV